MSRDYRAVKKGNSFGTQVLNFFVSCLIQFICTIFICLSVWDNTLSFPRLIFFVKLNISLIKDEIIFENAQKHLAKFHVTGLCSRTNLDAKWRWELSSKFEAVTSSYSRIWQTFNDVKHLGWNIKLHLRISS